MNNNFHKDLQRRYKHMWYKFGKRHVISCENFLNIWSISVS